MANKEKDFYHKLRSKIVKWVGSKEGEQAEWTKFIIWAPDLFYLLWKLSTDSDVPKSERVKLLAALAYFISPLDLIPEALLGPIAFADDIVLAAFVLNGLLNKTAPQVIQKHWPGEDDVLQVIQSIIAAADKMLGQKILTKLQNKIG